MWLCMYVCTSPPTLLARSTGLPPTHTRQACTYKLVSKRIRRSACWVSSRSGHTRLKSRLLPTYTEGGGIPIVATSWASAATVELLLAKGPNVFTFNAAEQNDIVLNSVAHPEPFWRLFLLRTGVDGYFADVYFLAEDPQIHWSPLKCHSKTLKHPLKAFKYPSSSL